MLEDLDLLMEQEGLDAIVAEGNAFEIPDIFWLTGFRSPDNIIYFKNRGDAAVVATGFNTLDRVKKESFITQTYDLSNIYVQLIRENKRSEDYPERIYGPLLKDLFAGEILGVPKHIPAHVLVCLQKLGYKIKVVHNLLTEARATKNSKELKLIKKAGIATVGAVQQVVDMIEDSQIGPNKKLLYNGNELTVGQLKLALDHFLVNRFAESAEDAIVAVGKKGFDYHYLGKPRDVLKANVPIIIDVFPRLKLDRYVADVTRTVVRGSASKNVKKMFEAVAAAAGAAVDLLTAGAKIDDINMACFQTLKRHGFESRKLNPTAKTGMLHGLGHGIGLEVHERPSLYNVEAHFKEGHVVAIEPGLYIPSIGGVRIENDYVVTKGKARLLTTNLEEFLYL